MYRVLILTSYDHIVSYGIARLLREIPSIELVQRNVNNAMLLPRMINELIPTAIIVDQGLFDEYAAFLCEAMRLKPGLKIMVLSNRENVIFVYEQKSMPIQTGEDLINEFTSGILEDAELVEA